MPPSILLFIAGIGLPAVKPGSRYVNKRRLCSPGARQPRLACGFAHACRPCVRRRSTSPRGSPPRNSHHCDVPFDPPIGLMEGLDMCIILRKRTALFRLQIQASGRLPPYLAKRVESASLNLRRRPLLRRCRGEPGAAVRDHHVRRRDAREQRPPSRGRLGAGEVPRQDVQLRACDENDQVAGDPDAVDEHHAMNLVDDLGHGPDPPEPRRLAPEGPALTRHIELGFLRQQPSDEGSEVPGGGVVGVGRARPARTAAPALRAGPRAPVSLHFASASRAFLVIHGNLRRSVTFYRDFPGMTCVYANE